MLIPVGSHGDVHPFVGIGIELRRRGHDVVVIANGHFESLIRAAGLTFAPLGTQEQYLTVTKNRDLWSFQRGFATVMGLVTENLRLMYDAIDAQVVPGRTVLVAHTLAFAALVMHEKTGIPTASVHTSPAVIRSVHEMPVFFPSGLDLSPWPRWSKRLFWWLTDALVVDRTLCPPLNRFRAEFGLPPLKHPFRGWLHAPQLTVGLWPDWYAPPQPDWPPQVRCAGFPLYDESDVSPIEPELERFLAAGDRPIVFTPGSAMVHGHDFFAACASLNRRGVLLTRFAEQVPPSLPPNVRHFAYAPLSRLLPRCAALVHHGGIGTTAQALRAGLPQVIRPMTHDQPDNAARIKRLGVGDFIPVSRFNTESLTHALRQLLESDATPQRCREVADKLAHANAIESACTLLEKVAE